MGKRQVFIKDTVGVISDDSFNYVEWHNRSKMILYKPLLDKEFCNILIYTAENKLPRNSKGVH